MLFDPVLPDGTVVGRTTPRSWYAFAAVATGLSIGRYFPLAPSLFWFAIAAALGAASLLLRGRPCRAALWTAAVCLSAGWFTAYLLEPAATSLLRRLPADAIIRVRGIVLDSPQRPDADPDPLALPLHDAAWRMRLKLTDVDIDGAPERASGRLWVRITGDHPDAPARAGERVWIEGVLSAIAPPMNPGEPDRRLWAAQDGYCGSLRAGEVTLDPTAAGPLLSAQSRWCAARAWLSDRAHALLLGPPGSAATDRERTGRALLAALILGEEEPALRETRSAFARLGLSHVLAISGFHLAVLSMVALLALRAVGDLGWREPAFVAALILLYLMILPFNAPVWRSGLMVLALLAADAAGRRYDRLTLLGWIAVALILWRPMDLWSIGFQLSFGLVALLLWMGDAVDARLWRRPLRGVVPTRRSAARRAVGGAVRGLKRGVSTNVMCCSAAAPVVMYHTGLVSLLAVASGVVVVPLITLVLIAGYAAAGVGVLIPGAASAMSRLLADLAGWTAWLVERIDETPWSSARVPGVSVVWAGAATGVVLYWLARGERRSRGLWAVSVAVALWGGAEMWFGSRLPGGVALRVDTLAVGDGTCQIVRSGDQALLWDCGSLAPGVGRMLVPRAARALGATRVSTALVTHPNIDHFNGLLDVIEPLRIGRVLVGEAFVQHAAQHPRSAEAYVLSELRRRGVEVRVVCAGERLDLGPASVEIVSPAKGAAWREDNNMSLVGLVSVKGRAAALLCGDIQGDAMEWVRAQRPGLRVPVMEAPHHGSAREPAYGFVADLGPRVVLQSTGLSRAADPRWDEVRSGRTWWCTALDGAAWAEVGWDGRVRTGAFRW